MKARQMGTPMATVMATATKYGEPYVGFVHKAYDLPRLTSEAAKDVVTGSLETLHTATASSVGNSDFLTDSEIH